VKVGLILPLSAPGNAALTGQSMRNAAELALAEYNSPDVQLLVKDDGGTPQGTQQAVQQALDEGAEVLVGPVFAQSVGVAGQLARQRGVPVIAFSTDANVASRGVYLLSFLPESDVDRIVEHALGTGKRSFAALVPENAYGSVVEAALKQTAARRNARIVVLERYSADPGRDSRVRMLAQSAASADAILIADGGEAVPRVMQALVAAGVDPRRIQLLGTGLWDDPRIFADPALQGGLYAAPDGAGYRAFAGRYRQKFGQDPVRTASLAYDAMALVAALAKTQGPQRFAEEVLTSPAGFAGIDGVFRLRPEGTNQRGLAVMRVGPGGGQVVAPAPRAFSSSGL
jgi:ABC-type branched-subunit amino acid transport system substrate-binding protein